MKRCNNSPLFKIDLIGNLIMSNNSYYVPPYGFISKSAINNLIGKLLPIRIAWIIAKAYIESIGLVMALQSPLFMLCKTKQTAV